MKVVVEQGIKHTLEHLELKEGSVLVIKFPTNTSPETVNQVIGIYAQELENCPYQITALVAFENSQSIEHYDEATMNKLGWVRADKKVIVEDSKGNVVSFKGRNK